MVEHLDGLLSDFCATAEQSRLLLSNRRDINWLIENGCVAINVVAKLGR